MQDSYLSIFDKLFFNVEEHDNIKEIIEQSSDLLSSIIIRFGDVANAMITGTSRKDDFVDTVIILFIRKIIEQLDAINVLYSVTSFETAKIILRSLMENTMGIEFILKEDTKKRAAAYYLERHYQELDKSKITFNAETKSGKQMMSQIGKAEFDKICGQLEKKKQALGRLIKSEKVFQDVDQARKQKIAAKKKQIGKNRPVYIKWYEVCSDIRSIRALMKEVGYEKYYDSIYGALSYESHGWNATKGIRVDEKGFLLKQIRDPEDGNATFDLACNFSIRALFKIYQYLGDKENEKAEFRAFFEDFDRKRDIVSRKFEMIRSRPDSESESLKDV